MFLTDHQLLKNYLLKRKKNKMEVIKDKESNSMPVQFLNRKYKNQN